MKTMMKIKIVSNDSLKYESQLLNQKIRRSFVKLSFCTTSEISG